MQTQLTALSVCAFFFLLCQAPIATAAEKATYTTILVDDMHCSTCAKKVARKLYAVAGVVEVRANVKKNLAYVVPQKEKSPSPRQMWEAVQSAGFKPLKLAGPGGTFTTKPRF